MRYLPVIGSLLLCACVSTTTRDEPALIVDANRESHDEIVGAVSSALQVSSITIADDALTQDSVLLIERTPARDAAGRRLSGRDLETPEQFRLVKQGDRCVLVHSRSGARSVLSKTKCSAKP